MYFINICLRASYTFWILFPLGQKYAMIEMKVILALVLSEYVVSTNVPQKDVRVTYGFITGPSQPLYMTLTPRKKV